jgi:hypothetical protein
MQTAPAAFCVCGVSAGMNTLGVSSVQMCLARFYFFAEARGPFPPREIFKFEREYHHEIQISTHCMIVIRNTLARK